MMIVADVGSTHMGKDRYVKEIIERLAEAEVDVVKFQLFDDTEDHRNRGNVYMTPDLFAYAHDTAKRNKIKCTASVFSKVRADELAKYYVPFVKFAYSQRESSLIQGFLNIGREVIVTCDVMGYGRVHESAKKLYTATIGGHTLYPCDMLIDFEGKFPKFDGFSDHTLKWEQTIRAVAYGAKIIEKHVTLPYNDIRCPDKDFALEIGEWKKFVQDIKSQSVP